MTGFVDVSNMSNEQVRRMGHADDYAVEYRNPYAYRKPANKTPKVTFSHNAIDVWAAAVQAQAINGVYVKAVITGEGSKTNRMIVNELLADTTQIKEESFAKGEVVRQYFKGLTFKVLQGKALSEFNNTAMTIANKDTITSAYDIAVIVSLPASYEKSTKRDDVDRRINFARGGYVGVEGDKVQLEIEVVKQVWSQNWNIWFVTGITDDDQVVFFSFKKQVDIGERFKIAGTVKGIRDNSTQLNRVKIVK